jgi:fumarate hydratase subunit alpha
MREIKTSLITDTIAELCRGANCELPEDMRAALHSARGSERSQVGRGVLGDLESNLGAAKELGVPICQDTGMAIVFMSIGRDVHITGGSLREAVDEGVRRGYVGGRLRLSVVSDPIKRENSGDNTPAILYTDICEGGNIDITVAPKGFGSENMSAIKMFTPAASRQDIIDFVAGTVSAAGSRPCPPVVLGVGIGGDFEYCAYLAKKALTRPLSVRSGDEYYRALEDDMLAAVNRLGIGPQGFGGSVTALGVNIEHYATHIAGLPVAVNVGCHVTRHRSAKL